MPTPRWDDEMKFELLRLKSELRPENFKVLAQPLGLGRVSKKEVHIDEPTLPHLHKRKIKRPAMPAEKLSASSEHIPKQLFESGHSQQKPNQTWPSHQKNRFSALQFSLAHIVDLAFVLSTLGLGVVLMGWIFEPNQLSLDLNSILQMQAIVFLTSLQPLPIIMGVYTFFILYWLFFKVISGMTLGESWLANLNSRKNKNMSASVQVSRDS